MAKKRSPQRKSSSKASSSKSSSKGRFSGSSSKKAQRSKTTAAASNPLLGNFFEQQIYPRAGLVAMCLVGLLFLIVFGDYFFGKYLYLFKDMGSDSLNIFYPQFVHYADLLREEGMVGWSFKQGMGQDITGMALGNPFNWLFYMVGASGIPYIVIYGVFLEIMLGGWIFNRYLKLLGYTPFTIIVGTLLFAFCGFVFGTSGFWNFWKLTVGGVLLLYCAELLIQKDKWWPFPIAVFFLAGPRLFLFIIFLIVYTILRHVDLYGWNTKKLLITGGKMMALGLIGIMISAYTFMPAVNNLINSPRIAGDASSFNALLAKPIFGFPSEEHELGTSIMRLFSSEMMGTLKKDGYNAFWNYFEAPFYSISTLGLLLIPLVFFQLDKRKKMFFAGFAIFWLIPMIFPFFRHAFFLYAAPHYRLFSLLITFAFLFFALRALNQIDLKNRVHIPTLLGASIVLLILLNLPYFDKNVTLDPVLHRLANIFIILNTGLIFLLRNKKMKYIVHALMVLSIFIEYGYTYNRSIHDRGMVSAKEWNSRTGYNDYTKEALAFIKEKEKAAFYRIHQYYNSSPAMHSSLNDAFVFNYYSTPSYQSSNQPNYLAFLQKVKIARENNVTDAKWAPGLRGRYALEIIASVKYNFTKKGSTFRQPSSLVTKIGEFEDVEINKMNLSLPFGFTYDTYMTYEDFLTMGQRKIDKALLKSAVIFEEDQQYVSDLNLITSNQIDDANPSYNALQTDVERLKQDTIVISSFTQDHIEGKIQLEKKKLVFFSFPYDKGWKATVDGQSVNLIKANIGLTGLVLEAGNHEIKLWYQMPYINIAKFVSVLGLTLFIGLILLERRIEKNNFYGKKNE